MSNYKVERLPKMNKSPFEIWMARLGVPLAIIALMPGVGVVKWNDVDIPWHLMLFSAGAYTLGSGLNATDLPNTMVNAAFDAMGITPGF